MFPDEFRVFSINDRFRKKYFPRGANSFLLEQSSFSEGGWCVEKQ